MIVVHHLENSRSQRIVWLLEELELDYEIKRYDRDTQTSLAPPELLAVHPLGKSPVISDGGKVIAESGAIVEYLLETYDQGKLLPDRSSPDYQRYKYWLHFAEGTFMPYMVFSLVVGRIETAPMPFFVKPIARGIARKVRDAFLTPNISRNLDFMEQALTDDAWFAGGGISGADIMMIFPVEAAAVRASLEPQYGRLADYLRRVHARPAYQRALERGGPYALLGG
ncbi:MAG: glutathione S-transferase [Gammaproteobacteria bacterium]